MSALLPLELGEHAALFAAPVLGFAFGWFLERGGLGHPAKLAAQFYLRDLTVFKVLFSALITALLGAFWLGRLGLLELPRVYVPETFLLPQLAGGAIFGVGFVLAGLCPGTSCVAWASGRWDGLAVMAGMLAGVLGYMLAYPLLQPFANATSRGSLTLPQLLHLPTGVLVAAVTALALAGFALAERIERRRGRPVQP
jgi:uncharacterized membrane protein YedE/YeeE